MEDFFVIVNCPPTDLPDCPPIGLIQIFLKRIRNLLNQGFLQKGPLIDVFSRDLMHLDSLREEPLPAQERVFVEPLSTEEDRRPRVCLRLIQDFRSLINFQEKRVPQRFWNGKFATKIKLV